MPALQKVVARPKVAVQAQGAGSLAPSSPHADGAPAFFRSAVESHRRFGYASAGKLTFKGKSSLPLPGSARRISPLGSQGIDEFLFSPVPLFEPSGSTGSRI